MLKWETRLALLWRFADQEGRDTSPLILAVLGLDGQSLHNVSACPSASGTSARTHDGGFEDLVLSEGEGSLSVSGARLGQPGSLFSRRTSVFFHTPPLEGMSRQ